MVRACGVSDVGEGSSSTRNRKCGEIEQPGARAGTTEQVGEFELASRLSYFLWSTMPDDELLDLAKRGELRKNQDAQVKAMLASPKFKTFTSNFAGQ